jgi:hypothetical protein
MKNIKKLAIIFVSVSTLYSMDITINKNYINELLNYKVELPTYIDNPFLIKKQEIVKKKKPIKKVYISAFVEKSLDLIAVLNNKALVKVEGLNLKKWVKEGDTIDGYKIKKIINDNSILVSIKNKTKIVSIKEDNNINIKVEQ